MWSWVSCLGCYLLAVDRGICFATPEHHEFHPLTQEPPLLPHQAHTRQRGWGRGGAAGPGLRPPVPARHGAGPHPVCVRGGWPLGPAKPPAQSRLAIWHHPPGCWLHEAGGTTRGHSPGQQDPGRAGGWHDDHPGRKLEPGTSARPSLSVVPSLGRRRFASGGGSSWPIPAACDGILWTTQGEPGPALWVPGKVKWKR